MPGRGGGRLRNVLVVAEIALSVVLLLGAGLLMRTFINIQRVEPGFEPRGVLTMRLTLPRERYPGEAGNVFFDALIERLGGAAAGARGRCRVAVSADGRRSTRSSPSSGRTAAQRPAFRPR